MKLVFITALVAVCGAAKLDRTYLPPASAKTAGGGFGDLLTPIVRESFQPGRNGLPKGAEENEFDGVVVEAAAPGTRASSPGESGLGSPRISYGSTHSKVGEAAFKTTSQHQRPAYGHNDEGAFQFDSQTSQSFHQGAPSDFIRPRPQSAIERTSSTLRFENNIGPQAYSYAYETENGITAVENGVNINGVQAEGGYSYTGDDGKLYKITYTAGEGGYQPVGDHLPTPPPIPDEILKSLEQNARDDAAGLVDDGSYDATKYNAEDDYTKSDSSFSRQPAFGKKPESDFDASGTFINQNNRPFESSHRHREQQSSVGNHFIPPHFDAGLNDKFRDSIKLLAANSGTAGQDNSETNIFAQQQNAQTGSDGTFVNSGSSESDKKFESDDEFGLDDYSRPINLGSKNFNQFSNEQKVNIQNHPQISSFGEKFTNNVEYNENKFSAFPRNQLSNTFSGIPSTLQPSLELSTPFEYYMNSNHDSNHNPQDQNERSSPLSTLQPFSPQVTPNSQSKKEAQGVFPTANNNVNLQLRQNNSQQSSNYFQQLPDKKEQDLNVKFQYNSRPDNSYYYSRPSQFFNPYSKPNTQTLVPSKQDSVFTSSVSTKYPSPTVETIISSSVPDNMFNQYADISQVSSFKSPNEGFGASTKYPQPPTVGRIIPAPTSPTVQSGETFFAQHTGITQASASPFPTTSPSKYNPNYNFQRIEPVSPNSSQNLHSNNVQEETNIKVEGIHVQGLNNVPNFDTVGSQTRPIQQYDGEVYEYKKPMETLSTPTDSVEPIQQNDFTQFGQKLKPSIQTNTPQFNQIQKQHGNSDALSSRFPAPQPSPTGTKPLFESQTFQSQFSLQPTLESINKGFDDSSKQVVVPTTSIHSTRREQSTQSSLLQSGAFPEVQTAVDYKAPFEFSSRIKPCCQGPRKSSIGHTPEHPEEKDFQSFTPLGQQSTNGKPGFQSGRPFGFQSNILEKESESAQTTSQSLFTAEGEEFNRQRRPPSFDEATGYHY